jgi:hypothetical protein
MCRPGEWFINGHSKVTGGSDPLDWFPEELNWSGFGMRLPALAKGIAERFETWKTIVHLLSHRSRSLRYVSMYLVSSDG